MTIPPLGRNLPSQDSLKHTHLPNSPPGAGRVPGRACLPPPCFLALLPRNLATPPTGAAFQGPWGAQPHAKTLEITVMLSCGNHHSQPSGSFPSLCPSLPTALITTPTSPVRKQKLRGVKQFAQGHTAEIQKSQDLKPQPWSMHHGEGGKALEPDPLSSNPTFVI